MPQEERAIIPIDIKTARFSDGELALLESELTDQAFKYRVNAGLPAFAEGGFEKSARIVGQAFKDGLGIGYLTSLSRKKIREVIKSGLIKRNNIIIQGAHLLNDLKVSNLRHDLGIPNDIIAKVDNEVRNQGNYPVLQDTKDLILQTQKRQIMLPQLSPFLLQEWSGLAEEDDLRQLQNKLNTPDKQATIIRGLVASSLLNNLSGEQLSDPLYLTDDDLERLNDISYMDKINIGGMYLPFEDYCKIVCDRQAQYLADTFLFDPEITKSDIGRFLIDYSDQVLKQIKSWIKTSTSISLDENPFRYWSKKYNILKGIPIQPLIPGEQFAYSAEDLPSSIENGNPSLWDNRYEIGSFSIPSEGDIIEGLRILAAAGFIDSDLLVIKLKSAALLWRKHHADILGITDYRIEQVADLTTGLRDQSGELSDLSLITNLRELGKLIGAARQRHAYFERVRLKNSGINSQYGVEVSHKPETSTELTRVEQKLIISSILLCDKYDISRTLQLQDWDLNRSGWIDLSKLTVLKGKKVDYYNPDYISSEIELIDGVIEQLNSYNLNLAEIFSTDINQIQKMIGKISIRTPYTNYDRHDQIAEALSLVRTGFGEKRMVRSLIVGDLEKRRKELSSQKTLLDNYSQITAKQNLIAGNITTPLDSDIFDEHWAEHKQIMQFFSNNKVTFLLANEEHEVKSSDYILANLLIERYKSRVVKNIGISFKSITEVKEIINEAIEGDMFIGDREALLLLKLLRMNLSSPFLESDIDFTNKVTFNTLLKRFSESFNIVDAFVYERIHTGEFDMLISKKDEIEAKVKGARTKQRLIEAQEDYDYLTEKKDKAETELLREMGKLDLVVDNEMFKI